MDINELRSLQEAYLEVVENQQQVDEAVRGQDNEMRKAASAERRSGDKRSVPSRGKEYADKEKQSISYMDTKTKKNKAIVGMTHEEVKVDEESGDYDTFDIILDYIFEEELVDTLEEALVLMSELDQNDIDFILDEAFKQFPEKKVSRKIQREKDRLTGGVDRSDKASGSQVQGRQDELNRKRAGRIMKMSNTMNDKTFTSPKERSKMNARAQKTVRTVDRIKDRQVGGNTSKDRSRSYGLDPKLKSKKKEEPKKSESTSTTSKRKSLALKAARAAGKVAGTIARKLSK